MAAARPAPDTYPINTATAPALMSLYESVARDARARAAATAAEDSPARGVYQRALFHELQRVVQIPTLPSSEPARPRRATTHRVRTRRAIEGQQSLDFEPAAEELNAPPEPVIYCNAPVALPTHRALASALDTSMILMGLGLFLLTFQLAGGQIILNRQTIPLFGGITAVLALFYHFLFCLCGGDTAGMRWTQLRLVNFDGNAPDREQRACRLVGSCLSLVAAGLGIIWALVDEESLTWHDHISKTFPSPQQARS